MYVTLLEYTHAGVVTIHFQKRIQNCLSFEDLVTNVKMKNKIYFFNFKYYVQ